MRKQLVADQLASGLNPLPSTYFYLGGLAEWPIAPVLKMGRDANPSLGSSNLPASVYAKNIANKLYKLSTLSKIVSVYHLLYYKKGGKYG